MNWRVKKVKGELTEVIYCRFKGTCSFKVIRKSPRTKGLYYVLCDFIAGCNQKTYIPKRIKIPIKEG